MIGIIPAAAWYFSNLILPGSLAALTAVTMGILVTGALHEDGLCDTADGLVGGNSRERRLEIMKDSRIGTYGAIALLISIVGRWQALSFFDIHAGVLALLTTHTLARATMAIPIKFATYARSEGLGASVSANLTNREFAITAAIAALFALVLGGMAGIISLFIAAIISLAFTAYVKSKIGGYTGDGLGAVEQLAEMTILITLLAIWGTF